MVPAPVVDTPPAAAPEDIVEKIQRVLGNGVVMLSIPSGQKAPQEKGWQKKTLECMLEPEYKAKLRSGNVGIVLGKPSGNVCAIDIDDDAAVEPFLDLNPKLGVSLMTRGSRGCQIWVKLTDTDAPKPAKLVTATGQPWGEWRADGNQSVIHGLHPKGMAYHWFSEVQAVEIAFDEIVWPEDIKQPWGDRAFRELVGEVGEPIVGKSLNVSFFARVFTMKNVVGVYQGQVCLYGKTTGLWQILDAAEVNQKLWAFVRQFLGELGAGDLKGRLKPGSIDEVCKLLLTEAERLPLKSDDKIIHAKNGMIDLSKETPVLLPFDPSFGSIRRVEIDYDATAQCPRFTDWLNGAMSTDDVSLFQEWCGAVLLGPNHAQRLLLIHGEAGAGKSSFVTLVEKVIGLSSCQQLRVNQLGTRFEMREYATRVLLAGKDVPADFLNGKNASILKSLTGGDQLTTERKNENDSVTFQSRLHLVVVSNEELTLRIEGDAGAWERRLLSIGMKKPEQLEIVPDIAEVLLKAEGPGILAWFVEGARRHLNNGHRYALTAGQLSTVQKIVDRSDGVRQFVIQKLMVEDVGGNSQVTMTELSDAYEKFARAEDFDLLNKQVLGRKLVPLIESRLGLRQRHDITTPVGMFGQTGEVRGYRGLVIVP